MITEKIDFRIINENLDCLANFPYEWIYRCGGMIIALLALTNDVSERESLMDAIEEIADLQMNAFPVTKEEITQ